MAAIGLNENSVKQISTSLESWHIQMCDATIINKAINGDTGLIGSDLLNIIKKLGNAKINMAINAWQIQNDNILDEIEALIKQFSSIASGYSSLDTTATSAASAALKKIKS